MRFAPGKTKGHQAILTHHHTRDRLVRQMTQVVDAIRSPLAEFEIVGQAGVQSVDGLLEAAAEHPTQAGVAVDLHRRQLHPTRDLVAKITRKIETAQRQEATACRRTAIPGVGVLTTRAITATCRMCRISIPRATMRRRLAWHPSKHPAAVGNGSGHP